MTPAPGMRSCPACGCHLQRPEPTSSWPDKVRAHCRRLFGPGVLPPELADFMVGSLIAHAMVVHPTTAKSKQALARLVDLFLDA